MCRSQVGTSLWEGRRKPYCAEQEKLKDEKPLRVVLELVVRTLVTQNLINKESVSANTPTPSCFAITPSKLLEFALVSVFILNNKIIVHLPHIT